MFNVLCTSHFNVSIFASYQCATKDFAHLSLRKRHQSPKAAPVSKRRQAAATVAVAETTEETYESSGEEDGSEPGEEVTSHPICAPTLKPSLQSAPTTSQAAAVPVELSPLLALASGSGLSSGPSPLQLHRPSPLAQLAAVSTAHTAEISPLAALSSSLKQQTNHTDEEDYDV